MIWSCASPCRSAACADCSGARHHGVQRDVARVLGLRQQRVLVHHAREQRRIERAPVDADAHRLAILDGHFDHGAEVVVRLAADIRVAGIDAVLGERARALRIFLEQQVAVVVEVADDRHRHAERGAAYRQSSGTAAAAASVFTVTRTSSEPARASAITWLTVDATSAVSVLVIDCTTIG